MYRVKFWNPITGNGFIEGYKTAAQAWAQVKRFNENFQDGGLRALYLGRDKGDAR